MQLKIKSLTRTEEIILSSRKIKTISFDLFDTLFYRKLPAENIKKNTSVYFVKKYAPGKSPEAVYYLRKNIEQKLQQVSVNSGYDSEYRFIECINEWIKEISGSCNSDISDDLISFEISNEIDSIELFPETESVLLSLKEKGYTILYCSDMYLPQKYIELILEKKGIKKYFDRGYISSEYLLRKDTSNLFEIVLTKEKINPEQLIHIGDNYKSDYKMALRRKINAILIHNSSEKKRYNRLEKVLRSGRLSPGIIESIVDINNYHRKRTYACESARLLSYPFLLFVNKLAAEAENLGVKKVFFLSREGIYFKGIFDYINNTEIESRALYLSRMALFILTVDSLNRETLIKVIQYYEKHDLLRISADDIITLFKIEKNEASPFFEKYKIPGNLKQKTGTIKHDERFFALFDDYAFNDLFIESKKKYIREFTAYLKTASLLDEKKILLVDLGWNGSMQDYISVFLKENYGIETYGYYLGYRFSECKASEYKNGYIKIEEKSPRPLKRMIDNLFMEIVTSIDKGSVTGYKDSMPQFAENSGENEQYYADIKPIQEAIIERIGFLAGIRSLFISGLDPDKEYEYAVNNITTFAVNPPRKVRRILKKLVFFENLVTGSGYSLRNRIIFFSSNGPFKNLYYLKSARQIIINRGLIYFYKKYRGSRGV